MSVFGSPESRFYAHRRVLIHFTNQDSSLDGYVVRETRDSYWLQQAKVLETKSREFDMEGTLIVPKRSVFFVQVLAESAA